MDRNVAGRIVAPLALALVTTIGLAGCEGSPVEPDPPAVASVEVTPDTASLVVGDGRKFTATPRTLGGAPVSDADVEWSSSDTTVAIVTETGMVWARGAGEAWIRARVRGGAMGQGLLRVPAPPTVVAFVELNTDSMTSVEGIYPTFVATARDSAGEVVPGKLVQWTSSDPSTAPVRGQGPGNATGVATALRPGRVVITARVEGVVDSVVLTIEADHPYDLMYSGWAGVAGVAPDLYRLDIREAGADPTPIPVAGLSVTDAVPSPDGERMVFSGNHYGYGGGLFLADIDGSSVTRLTSDPFDDLPAWSPDGERIAFRRWRFGDGEDADIWVIGRDGSGLTNLTDGLGATNQSWPTWSPEEEGRYRIAFSHAADGEAHIWTMLDDGTEAEPVTSGAVWDDQPAWSPDGTMIVFQRTHEGSTSDLYLTAPTGGAARLLLQTSELPGSQWAPAWSPDSRLVAFTSRHEGIGADPDDYQVYTADPFGQRIARRTEDATDKVRPVFVVR